MDKYTADKWTKGTNKTFPDDMSILKICYQTPESSFSKHGHVQIPAEP